MPVELDPRRGYGILAMSVVLGLTVLISLGAVGYIVGARSGRAAETAAERRTLIAEALTYACEEIEKLRAGEREAARKAYRDLDKTLRLLKLERTPEIEQSARESRDAKLERYKAVPCPVRGEIP